VRPQEQEFLMMTTLFRRAFVGMTVAAMTVGFGQSAGAAERFEVESIKAVRPTLVDTASALQKGNVKAAKEAFAAFDSAWNGIEVYINTRDMEMYNTLERVMQAKLTEGLNGPSPNAQDLLAQAKAMLAKFDEAIAMVVKAAPLNPLYDDVARLRIERAHLREVNPALKAGDLAKARKSFNEFEEGWDPVEDLVKIRSREAYDAIEDGTFKIGEALKPASPDINQVTTLVSGVMDKYNTVVTQVMREARGR
jgi:tetratricopeptide (TPR) repeat protein